MGRDAADAEGPAPAEAWPTTPLTRRQWELFNWMVEFTAANFYQPSVREIGVEFRIKSPNGVMCHLKALNGKGLIDRPRAGQSRALDFRRRAPLPESAMHESRDQVQLRTTRG